MREHKTMTRRGFVGGGAALAATVTMAKPFEALASYGRRCAGSAEAYGPLLEAIDETTGLPLIRLPAGFRYLSFGWTGDPMTDGAPTPAGHDGGAALWGAWGRVYYVRNHELSYRETSRWQTSFADEGLTYDGGQAPGGTTTVVFDSRRGRYVRTIPSLSGTVRNCAGGPTPWNTWLSCEESLDGPEAARDDAALRETHGWVFEVPARRRASAEPLRGMGRFNHEAAAVDPWTGIVYETEDRATSGIYRYVPRYWGWLRAGGELQMLAVRGQPQLDTSTGLVAGDSFEVEWVTIEEPERRDAEPGDGAGVFTQGLEKGGAVFRRGEGMWYGHGKIYFTCTSGGEAGEGQVFELDPRADTLRLLFESPSEDVLDNPDNITVSPRGGILLCEDGDASGLFLRGLTCEGQIFDFAQNNVVLDGEVNDLRGDFRGKEWAGACFTPCGTWLLVSIQTPGVTFAITGPWRNGVL